MRNGVECGRVMCMYPVFPVKGSVKFVIIGAFGVNGKGELQKWDGIRWA